MCFCVVLDIISLPCHLLKLVHEKLRPMSFSFKYTKINISSGITPYFQYSEFLKVYNFCYFFFGPALIFLKKKVNKMLTAEFKRPICSFSTQNSYQNHMRSF